MTTGRIASFFVSVLLFLFLSAPASTAQAASPAKVDPAVAALAGKLAEGLHKIKAKRVAIFDLSGPEREEHPIGKWLAEQLSVALPTIAPDLQIIDRSGFATNDTKEPSVAAAYEKSREVAKMAGADSLVRGSFAGLSNRIGITLSVMSLNRRENPQVTGAVPISDEIRALSSQPIPSFTGGIPRAGMGGVTNPTCKRCPLPEYTSQARAAKYEGTVTLDVTITAEGTAGRIIVIRGPGYGLEERSVEAVRKWQFKPALDVDGKLVAAKVEIEVTFRMLY